MKRDRKLKVRRENTLTSKMMPRTLETCPAYCDFGYEDELLPLLMTGASKNLFGEKGQTVIHIPKLQVGMMIPDVVVVTADSPSTNQVKAGRLSYFESALVSKLVSSGPSSGKSLSKELYAQDTRTVKALLKLLQNGILSLSEDGKFSIEQERFPTGLHIISVEAKLRRWRDAIDQAKEYLKFSNESFVALPSHIALGNPSIRKACSDEGLGLIAVERTGATILLSSKWIRPVSQDWIWLIGKTIGFYTPCKSQA